MINLIFLKKKKELKE